MSIVVREVVVVVGKEGGIEIGFVDKICSIPQCHHSSDSLYAFQCQ